MIEMNDNRFSTAPKPFVFVLMPFNEDFDDIYKIGIKETAKEVGAYAERVDEQNFTEGILERIFNQINKADVIVADMSRRNPNVFYEVGYAHALGKIVLLLTQTVEDIPFDLKHRQHIVYGIDGSKIQKLRKDLTLGLNWAIDESRKKIKEKETNRILLSISDNTKNYENKLDENVDFIVIPEACPSERIPTIDMDSFSSYNSNLSNSIFYSFAIHIYNNSSEEITGIHNITLFTKDEPFLLPSYYYESTRFTLHFNPEKDDKFQKKFVHKTIFNSIPPKTSATINIELENKQARTGVDLYKLRIHFLYQYHEFLFYLKVTNT